MVPDGAPESVDLSLPSSSSSSSLSTTANTLSASPVQLPTFSLNEPGSLTLDTAAADDTVAIKKARRQTAFYPNMKASNSPSKPFSKSAAKRGSVMALGSIEHLQHYFTKTGLAAKKRPMGGKSKNFVPAIGGHLKSPSLANSLPEFQIDLPPSPAIPAQVHQPFPPFEKNYQTDPNALKPGVVKDLEAVCVAWGFKTSSPQTEQLSVDNSNNNKSEDGDGFDVLNVLQVTTLAIRSVRNYLVSLPDDHQYHLPKPSFRHTHLAPPPNTGRQSPAQDDSLSMIRRAALQVLTVLRDLEETHRIPLSDDGYDGQFDFGTWSRSRTPATRISSPSGLTSADEDTDSSVSFAFSTIQVPGRKDTVAVWSDDEDEFGKDEVEKKELWDERLVLGGGWLYRQGVKLESLQKEREVISGYLDVVDDVLFGGVGRDGRRGWERAAEQAEKEKEKQAKALRRVSYGGLSPQSTSQAARQTIRRVVSGGTLDAHMKSLSLAVTGEEPQGGVESDEPPSDDDDLPNWARRSTFVDNFLGRTHALLVSLLPVDLLPLLPSPKDKQAMLISLASGQLLCIAYNTGVRRSKKPWGYINQTAVHDIAHLEANAPSENDPEKEKARKKGWTFRRTENLRLWAAALKIRYLIPLITPSRAGGSQTSTPATSPSAAMMSFLPVEPPILFEPALIAKQGEGWQDILEPVVNRWVAAVVAEKRDEL